VKPGFKLELAAHEPQVQDPVAVSFDEKGRMYVCEMIDYSERRDQNPHLGRISVLEDKDGDGYYESSRVFADNLAWPTGLIWANGGLYVIATPDIVFLRDEDGDGRAEQREVVFTGFGTGLKILNVQGMANCPQWGMDCRIHLQAGGGNRGKIRCPKRPDLPPMEIGGRDFWFDPLTHDFGTEAGGGQFGMSYDNYGRKFVCSNSDHLQFFVCDDAYARRNPLFDFPQVRRSIASDGGAAEVFRISPDEPWRIIRTRWRIAGVVKGAVEGGGRVSGYFTGATGTTVYRGDAYGPDYLNNTFTGDAGGQLIHRKVLSPAGPSLLGSRPPEEQGREFAASTDTWCRIVNFANAPDGCLYALDMYRETIEHPWAIPDEIKQHLDLNSGNDRGRIYRITPSGWQRRPVEDLSRADLPALVRFLEHPNGWHRDCAARLLYERRDAAAVPLLETLLQETTNPLTRLHLLGLLQAVGAVRDVHVEKAMADPDEHVRERGVKLSEALPVAIRLQPSLLGLLEKCSVDGADRVRMQTGFTLGQLFDAGPAAGTPGEGASLAVKLAVSILQKEDDPWIIASVLSAPPAMARPMLERLFQGGGKPGATASLIRLVASGRRAEDLAWLTGLCTGPNATPEWLFAFDEGLRRAGSSLAREDQAGKFKGYFDQVADRLADAGQPLPRRIEAVSLLGLASFQQAHLPLKDRMAAGEPPELQRAAVRALGQFQELEVAGALLQLWSGLEEEAKAAAFEVLLARPARATALLEAVGSSAASPKASDFSAAQVQALVAHADSKVVALAKHKLASVIPQSRETVLAQFQPALTLPGDAARGQVVFMQRCFTCHRAGGQGFLVGPDLITVKNKGREALLSAVLEPHKEVAPQFIAYTVETVDGQTWAGILTKDDTSGVTIRMPAGQEVNVARSQVKKMAAGGLSLMPEGIEAGLDPQAMADLLEFVETLQ
jgi:putative membrane-bound dehydrogenase-like protein